MAKVMKSSEFVAKLKNIAMNYKTLYVMGCFGAPMTAANKQRYINHHSYNQSILRRKMIQAATADTFGFDCVCLIKSVLWGWDGKTNEIYGGAEYSVNGVPDIDADVMITKCSGVTTDFSKIEVGEAVWCKGHIGVYIGDGLAVECTPAWKNKVQITAVRNIGTKSGYHARTWTKHGKLPYIEYVPTVTPVKKSVDEIAKEVLQGKWGNGNARKSALTKAGYNYAAVQARVEELLKPATNKKSIDEIAKEVLDGKWYNGAARKSALIKAGYDYAAVQTRVDQLVKEKSKKSVDEIAREVLQGKWGNGATRKNRLTKAGYDYAAVQKRVEELLK